MPSVNSSLDGGYQYYQKRISDLEDELRDEHKRSEKRMEERSASLEENYKKNLESRDRETARTVEKIRETANEAIESDRRNSKAEIERVKSDTYDKFGRFNGNESDYLKQQLEEYRRGNQDLKAKHDRDLERAEKTFERRLADQREIQTDQTEKSIRNARDSANEAYSAAYKGKAAEHDQFKEAVAKQYQDLIRENQLNNEAHRKASEKLATDSHATYERMKDQLKDSLDARTKKLEETYADRTSKTARALASGHESETRALQQRMSELQDASKNYNREKGQATQDVIRQYDSNWRHQLEDVGRDFQKQIERLKEDSERTESYLAQSNSRNLAEKDRYFTGLISKANQENHVIRKDMEDTFEKARAQQELQMKHEREQTQKSIDLQLAKAGEQRELALKNQAKTFQNTLEQSHQNDADRIKSLEKALQVSSTSGDPSVISPAVESSLRKSITHEYEKTLSAEKERHQKAIGSLQQEYVNRINTAQHERQSSEATLQQQHVADREVDRKAFLAHVQDTEFNKAEALRNKDFESTKQVENLNRSYATLLERQRRSYDEVIQNLKNDSTYKLIAQRQEADFNLKAAHRNFVTRENDLVRDHEKKMADQKADYEMQIDELKAQSQLALRDMERKNKQALEEQSKIYEQRIAQSEYQHKERERYMTENFQDQLERTKRSNALSNSKKG